MTAVTSHVTSRVTPTVMLNCGMALTAIVPCAPSAEDAVDEVATPERGYSSAYSNSGKWIDHELQALFANLVSVHRVVEAELPTDFTWTDLELAFEPSNVAFRKARRLDGTKSDRLQHVAKLQAWV